MFKTNNPDQFVFPLDPFVLSRMLPAGAWSQASGALLASPSEGVMMRAASGTNLWGLVSSPSLVPLGIITSRGYLMLLSPMPHSRGKQVRTRALFQWSSDAPRSHRANLRDIQSSYGSSESWLLAARSLLVLVHVGRLVISRAKSVVGWAEVVDNVEGTDPPDH